MKILSTPRGSYEFHFKRLDATTRAQVLASGVRTLVEYGVISESDYETTEARMTSREETASSAIGGGVATPRALVKSANRATCLVAVNERGLDCGSLDGGPVDVFYIIVAPDVDSERALISQCLALSRACGGARLVRQCRCEDDVCELFELSDPDESAVSAS